jgi:hypothetical protein
LVVWQAYPGLGAAGQLVEVRPGFARNFLVPRGLARLLNHFQGKEFKVKYAAEQQELRDAGKRAQQGDVMNQVLERLTTHTVVSCPTTLYVLDSLASLGQLPRLGGPHLDVRPLHSGLRKHPASRESRPSLPLN